MKVVIDQLDHVAGLISGIRNKYRSWCDDVDKGKASAEVREKILTVEDDDIKKEPEEPEVNDTGQVE